MCFLELKYRNATVINRLNRPQPVVQSESVSVSRFSPPPDAPRLVCAGSPATRPTWPTPNCRATIETRPPRSPGRGHVMQMTWTRSRTRPRPPPPTRIGWSAPCVRRGCCSALRHCCHLARGRVTPPSSRRRQGRHAHRAVIAATSVGDMMNFCRAAPPLTSESFHHHGNGCRSKTPAVS